MSHTTHHTNRNFQGALLITMLLLFALVYNRRRIAGYIDPQPVVTAQAPNSKRAGNAWNRSRADSSIRIIKDGDLVLRTGSDAISNLFRKVNSRDKTYSHAGIVFVENGYPFVYHCTGSSADPYALLRRDSLQAYIGPYDNLGYAVYRYAIRPAQVEKLHNTAIRYFRERRTFDPHFDLATDSALYCTEFVFKAVTEATGDKKYFQVTRISDFSFITTDNLFSRKDARLVCRIAYIQ